MLFCSLEIYKIIVYAAFGGWAELDAEEAHCELKNKLFFDSL